MSDLPARPSAARPPVVGDEVRMTLRLPADLHDQVRQYATDQSRSVNAALVVLIRRGLEGGGLDAHARR